MEVLQAEREVNQAKLSTPSAIGGVIACNQNTPALRAHALRIGGKRHFLSADAGLSLRAVSAHD